MRIHLFGLFVLTAVLAGGLAPVRAQTLADVARKEEARRKATKDGGKTYTNNDLAPVPSTVAAPASGASAAPPPADAGKDAAAGEPKNADGKAAAGGEKPPAKDQAYWSKRMKELRDLVERDSAYAEAMQTRVNALTTDFTNRDDPAQRARIGVDRQKALNELDRLKKAIVDGRKAIADLEDEARRAGVPAGWLR